MEDYKQKYEEALDNFKKIKAANKDNKELVHFIEYEYPELKESEDECIRKELIRAFTVTADKRSHEIYGNGITYGQVLAWLEKQAEQKPTWSKEDEMMLLQITQYLISLSEEYEVDLNDRLNWLKSLKERYTWKPSDEQMKALNYVINLMASSENPTENDYYYNVLKDMRTQLKKLKGE